MNELEKFLSDFKELATSNLQRTYIAQTEKEYGIYSLYCDLDGYKLYYPATRNRKQYKTCRFYRDWDSFCAAVRRKIERDKKAEVCYAIFLNN